MVEKKDPVERSYGSVSREMDQSNTKTAYFTSLKNRMHVLLMCTHCETTKSIASLNDS